jgi:hypothetical protein
MGLLTRTTLATGEDVDLWPARATLVMKALTPVDARVPQEGVRYVRYMDDILVSGQDSLETVPGHSRGQAGALRDGLSTHPDKTWVGKAEQGCDFLGYQFNREGITVAPATVQHSVTRIRRLAEHTRRRPSQASAVGVYVSRW